MHDQKSENHVMQRVLRKRQLHENAGRHTMGQLNEKQKGWHCGSTPYTISPHITLSKCQSMENEMFHDGFFMDFRVYHAKPEANAQMFLPTFQTPPS